jgi:hypothetical protein
VFDDQHNLWTNMFASICVYSSQDAKRIGLRHRGCNTSKEDIQEQKKPKETMKKSMKWAVSQRTGGASDSEQ